MIRGSQIVLAAEFMSANHWLAKELMAEVRYLIRFGLRFTRYVDHSDFWSDANGCGWEFVSV